MPHQPFDGAAYQERIDAIAARGGDMHGEAALVAGLGPSSVLDAGCGTGRVAIELARRGVDVVGVDISASMLDEARLHAPDLEWLERDLVDLDLGRTFDVVLLAGNVPLFTETGTEAALVAACARHVATGGRLVAGFQLGRGWEVDDHDRACTSAGLVADARYTTWDGDGWDPAGDYAVLVHRRLS